jgi:hypothetical protein
MGKIISWVLANGATLLGLLQAIIKALKELATGIVNLLSLVIPNSKIPAIVEKVRGVFNTVDEVIEKLKGYLIK